MLTRPIVLLCVSCVALTCERLVGALFLVRALKVLLIPVVGPGPVGCRRAAASGTGLDCQASLGLLRAASLTRHDADRNG